MILAALITFGAIALAGDDPPVSLPPSATTKVDFSRDIQPIFAASCLGCHGSKKQKGGLALHRKASALAGGDDGPVYEPGKSAESRLIRYVAGLEPDHKMPPEDAGEPLKTVQIGLDRPGSGLA